jgi:integrase
VAELGLTVLADIDLAGVEKAAQAFLATGRTPKTVSLRVESLRCLCCWSVKRGLLPDNPLRGMARFDTRPKLPHRSLNDEEVAALLNAAPPHRRLWYEAALQTGFRLNELRSIRVKDLDRFGPTIFLAADYSKDRKDHRQIITRELADALEPLTVGRKADDRLLNIPKGPDPPAYIVADFTTAKISIKTDEGKATWHSLRRVFINNVVKSGADLKTIMEMARHSTATMSMDVYAKAKPDLLRTAAEAAAQHIKDAISASACCAGVAQAVSGMATPHISRASQSTLQEVKGIGDTGLEPVTGARPIRISFVRAADCLHGASSPQGVIHKAPTRDRIVIPSSLIELRIVSTDAATKHNFNNYCETGNASAYHLRWT